MRPVVPREGGYSARCFSFFFAPVASLCTRPAHRSQMDLGEGLPHSMQRVFLGVVTGASVRTHHSLTSRRTSIGALA